MEGKKRKLSKGQIRTIIVAAISAVVAIALIVTNFFVPVKYLGSYMVIKNSGAKEGVLRVSFLDVGYGDCTVVELPDGKNMLIDGGDGRVTNQSRILKHLNKCGISTIDYLVCTSVNGEHCGGLSELIQYKKVKRIYMPYCTNGYITDEYREFVITASKCGSTNIISEYGAGERNDEYGYFFKFLSPSFYSNPNGEYAELNSNPTSLQARNNASAVMWLEYMGKSFLFTSDAGNEVLKGICDSYKLLQEDYPVKLENCNVFKVANHGNSSSACAEIYDLTKPEIAVISVGENGQDCPSADTLWNAVNYVGKNLYRTDEHGTVTVEVTQDGYKII